MGASSKVQSNGALRGLSFFRPGPPQTSSFISFFEHSKRVRSKPWQETRKQERKRASSPPRTASTRGRRTRADRSRHPSECACMSSRCYSYSCCPPARSPYFNISYPPVFKICIPSHAVTMYLFVTPTAAVALSWCVESLVVFGAVSCCGVIRLVLGGVAVWAIRHETTQFHASSPLQVLLHCLTTSRTCSNPLLFH